MRPHGSSITCLAGICRGSPPYNPDGRGKSHKRLGAASTCLFRIIPRRNSRETCPLGGRWLTVQRQGCILDNNTVYANHTRREIEVVRPSGGDRPAAETHIDETSTKPIAMKLAIVGKGGVGKTTLAAALARRLASLGRPVVAVDADPDGNLASALGVPERNVPQPIAHMRDLILERTGARDDGAGLMFRLNPEVDDLPERFSVSAGGVRLLVLGTVESGGKGCMCPEGAVLKALLQHLLLRTADDVILDMEAGLEHMGRASARGVDAMISVVEPGMRSVQTATRIQKLATDIGIKNHYVVANKIQAAAGTGNAGAGPERAGHHRRASLRRGAGPRRSGRAARRGRGSCLCGRRGGHWRGVGKAIEGCQVMLSASTAKSELC